MIHELVRESFKGWSIQAILLWLIKLDQGTLQQSDVPEGEIRRQFTLNGQNVTTQQATEIRTALLQFVVDEGGIDLQYTLVPRGLNRRTVDDQEIEDPDHY